LGSNPGMAVSLRNSKRAIRLAQPSFYCTAA
jgi:hypothetical protein